MRGLRGTGKGNEIDRKLLSLRSTVDSASRGGVGEVRLVKHDVSGDQDAARGEVKASVPLVVRGVTKEHTTSRAGRQPVRSSGGGVRVTRTPEDPKVVVARRGTEKSVVWSGSRRSSGRKAVEQVAGGVKALSPEARGEKPGSEECA